jgi:hypothetical protein
MDPDKPLNLGNGREVQFHVPVDNVTRTRAAYGVYETSDLKEIELIRQTMKDHPYLFVFEN